MKTNFLNSQISSLISKVVESKTARNLLEGKLQNLVRQKIFNNPESNASLVSKQYQFLAIWSIYKSYIRSVDQGNISPKVTSRIIESFLNSVLLDDNTAKESRLAYESKYDMLPPTFMVISPTKKCNLNCIGCYASSSPSAGASLSWDLLDKIIEDAYSNMGMRFFVISGGEPLMYRSENKTIIDLAEKWIDCFFMMYTNGTLINEDVASRMAKAGNITPVISVEGYETETDERRGTGVFQRIIKAKNNLIAYGVPFGLSVTATKDNIPLLLNDSFYDFYFNEFGSTYMWVFQYMPIGRDFSDNLMISPHERLKLHGVQDKTLSEKNYFIADFWNSAPMSNGCIACGRAKGGYLYVNWDGNIMPCVFIPYYKDNIETLYESGKTLADALFSPLFVNGRAWQKKFIGNKTEPGNLLRPCFYRDHYATFHEIAKHAEVKPENSEADIAFKSKEYHDLMVEFGDGLEIVAEPVWQQLQDKIHENLNK